MINDWFVYCECTDCPCEAVVEIEDEDEDGDYLRVCDDCLFGDHDNYEV